MDRRVPASEHARREGATAVRNAVKLATSLLITSAVTLIFTFKLPNYLGPILWGHYKTGEQFAMSAVVFLGLGVDTYASREVAVRPKHASDFFLGVVSVRTLVLLPLFVAWTVWSKGKAEERELAAGLFGIAYVFNALNLTFQQMLQAASKVGGLAVANVAAKVLWGGGVLFAVVLGAPFWVVPLPMIASEALKCAFLGYATRKAIDLELRFDWKETKKVLVISFPFFVANVAVSLGSSIDVLVLGSLVSETSPEVGWYGAAQQIARMSALLSPVLGGVLIPMMSRAHARNEEDFFAILRRGIEGVAVVAIPLTLILALGAELVVRLLKPEFLPAANSLRWLAPTFVLSYGNVLLWVALMILGRSWTITIISITGLALLPPFIWAGVRLLDGWGPGGAGMGSAMAVSARELVILLVFLYFLGKRAIDRRSATNIGKSVLVSAVVVGAHVALTSLHPLVRLVIDGALYGVLALGLRILRPADVVSVLRLIKDRKKAAS
jgi:O-antigen/teichoic acid export membrane protein